ncbi:hypothetical protein GCM10018966_084200 [Streptomyces yanii]
MDVELRRGSYAVPAGVKQTLGAYAQKWLDANSVGPTTALRYEATVRNHIVEHLGRRELRSLGRPSVIREGGGPETPPEIIETSGQGQTRQYA